MLEILYEVGKILLTLIFIFYQLFLYFVSTIIMDDTCTIDWYICMCTVGLQVDPENKN